MLDSKWSARLSLGGILAAICLALYLSSRHSYLLFHSLIEIVTIAVAFTLFVLTWNSRAYLNNGYLRLLGTGYAFIALIDLIHTLAYKGMNVFPGYDANLPTQLWIAARYLQAVTLLLAPLCLARKFDDRAILAASMASAALLLVLVFSGYFPACFIEGQGLTSFKIASEYLISALLLVSLWLLHRQREFFAPRVFLLTAASIVFTVLSELSFTTYVSVYGAANMVGHFAKLAAFYLLYRAVLVTGFKAPVELIFRDLKEAEAALRKAHDSLEEKVRARTAELRDSEQSYRSLIEKVQTAIVLHDGQGVVLSCNPLAEALLGVSAGQLLGKVLSDTEWHFLREDGAILPPTEYPVRRVLASQQPLRGYLVGIRQAQREAVTWVLVNAEPEFDAAGNIRLVIVSFIDISQRQQAEAALHRLNRELRAISNCNQTLMHAEDEATLLNDICHIVCDEAGYRLAWVGYAEHDAAQSIRPVAWAGADSAYIAGAKPSWAADAAYGQGPAGTCIRSGQPYYVPDLAGDPHLTPWRQTALQQGYRSVVALPLKDDGGAVFGVLVIYSDELDAVSASELRLLEELAGDLAFGIVTLHTRLERRRAEELLTRREREFHSLVENIPDFIARFDSGGRHIYVGPSVAQLFGVAESTLLGKTHRDPAVPGDPARKEAMYQAICQVVSSGQAAVLEDRWITESGERAMETRLIPERDGAGDVTSVLGIARDITERRQAEQALHRLNRELRAISTCNQTLMHAQDEPTLLNDICRIVCEKAGYRMAWVGYAEHDEAKSLRPVAWAGEDSGYIEQARLTWADTELGRGPSGMAIRNGETASIDDFASDPKAAPWREAARQRGYRSSISLPLKGENGHTFGILNIYSGETSSFTAPEKRLLEELAGDLAFGIAVLRARIERNQAHELIEKRILALTRPMEDEAIAIEELFNLDEMQRIQDEFASAMGVASMITRPDGTPITAPSNFTYLCSEIIRKTERGCANCSRSDAAIGRYHPAGPIVQRCLSGGLWDAGASMSVGGKHIANWLIGQVRDETQTEESMRAYAREIGADETAVIAAFHKVPAMPRARFEQMARALFTMANQLSSAAYQNVQQARFITERKAAEKEIEHLAFYDLLTQLPNRRLLQDRLQQAMSDSSRSQHRGALLFIDLDNFKILNDTCGHDVGDQLLIEVAHLLSTCVREVDTVSRLGGDEFVVMLKDLGENPQEAAAQAKGVGEKILAELNRPYTIAGRVHHSTPSIGITLFLGAENSQEELLKQADIAMYQAKSAGRNTLRFFDPEMQASLAARADLESSLRRAIEERQFVLHYQPQVAGIGNIVGAEALLRWQHPERGMVSPAQFIPLAEETGLILPIGQWVLEEACTQLTLWAANAPTAGLSLAVNVSAHQFHQPDFVARVLEVLENTGAPAHRLKLEMTESMVLDNVEDTIAKMQALKRYGVGFSMDDFGTGYSSLSYLTRLPLDQLKIDQSFVRNLPDSANDALVTQAIITLANSLGLAVIAEGVESEAQRQFLSQHGCPVFQGYLFSKPVSVANFESLLGGGS
ncbi:MAG: diguanylate cyclase [Proteobacteria bacterium]|nr:diguanylate cyclase [Pseudomonadota bacterium]